jgi:hypothetical protein
MLEVLRPRCCSAVTTPSRITPPRDYTQRLAIQHFFLKLLECDGITCRH